MINAKNNISEEDYNGMVETLYILSHKKTANEILSAMQENPNKNTSYDPHEEW